MSAQARAARFERAARRRAEEAGCAWDFLHYGEPHDDCIFPARGEPRCSRDYDPGPPPEDEKLYENADLGALWNFNDNATYTLAGWNVRRRTR